MREKIKDKELCEALGGRLETLMKAKGMTQTRLAEKLGVSNAAVWNFINGACFPNIGTLVKIANALDCSSDYLLGIEKHNSAKETIMKQTMLNTWENISDLLKSTSAMMEHAFNVCIVGEIDED